MERIAVFKSASKIMRHSSKNYWGIFTFCSILLLAACNEGTVKEDSPEGARFSVGSLVKTDMGEVLGVHVSEARKYLRTLMVKLYKRNPRELKKSQFTTIQENLIRVFDEDHDWNFPELEGKKGIEAIRLTFSDNYHGDRVFSFITGLTSMIMASYNHKTEFYLLQSVDPQNLYNSARNIEIAVWKLEHDYDPNNELYLISNSRQGEISNLSYERLFGKLIGLQDTMAVIVAGKTNRTIIKAVQQMATAVFLPIF